MQAQSPVHFQGKPFNIMVIQVYAPTSNAEEAEVEQFYEDLKDLLEITPKKRCPFHYRGLEYKRNGNPLQYSCLENPWTEEPGGLQSMGGGKSQTRLSD